MFANTLVGGLLTRLREQGNASLYKNVGQPTNVREEVRISHTTAGKTKDGNSLVRHLVSAEHEVIPTAANGLKQSERVTVNLTITHTPGVPTAGGTGDFARVTIGAALTSVSKLVLNSTQGALSGEIPLASLLNGEV